MKHFPYARIKFLPRIIAMSTYPATVTVNNRPAKGKGPATRLTDRWVEFVKAINPEEVRLVMAPNSGWVNEGGIGELPLVQSLSMGGNVVRVLQRQGKFTRVDSLHIWDELPSLDARKNLWRHRFTCLNRRGQVVNPGANVECYFPFLTAGDAWMQTAHLEFFQTLPLPVWPAPPPVTGGYEAEIQKGAIVRTGPNGNKAIDKPLAFAMRVRISEELIGWCKYAEQRWVEKKFVKRI